MWIILIPNEYNCLAHTHLAIKEHKMASEYIAMHDRQITIAHLATKEHQIASNFFSKRERQVTSDHLAMLVTFAHLAMKERQIARSFFSKRERQVTTATPYVPNEYIFWIILNSYVCRIRQLFQNLIFCLYRHHQPGHRISVKKRPCNSFVHTSASGLPET